MLNIQNMVNFYMTFKWLVWFYMIISKLEGERNEKEIENSRAAFLAKSVCLV